MNLDQLLAPYGFDELNHPKLILLPKSGKLNHARYLLIQDFEIKLSTGFRLVIKAGFITDLSSIPRWAHSILSPAHTAIRIAVLVHDYLCDNWTTLQYELEECSDRKWCDQEFLNLCSGLNWRKYVMYAILRIHPKPRRMFYD